MRSIRKIVGGLLPAAAKTAYWGARSALLAHTRLYRTRIESVTVEVSSICNIRCDVCFIPTIRRRGLMKYADFQTILAKLPASVKTIRMNYAGEPLLNREIFAMVAHAKRVRPDIGVLICTNATTLGKFDPDEIIASGLDTLVIAVDGATKATHESYRVGSDFDAICASTRRLTERKRARGATHPEIVMQSLINATNVAQVEELPALARSLGVDRLAMRYMALPGIIHGIKEFPPEIAPLVAPATLARQIATWIERLPTGYSIYERDRRDGYRIKQEMHHCYSFLSPLIYFNGDMAVCCHDALGESTFGNLLTGEFASVIGRLPARRVYHKGLRICEGCVLSRHGVNYREVRFGDHAH